MCIRDRTDEVDRSCWFDKDVSNKLIAINDSSSVVGLVTNDDVIKDTSFRLNVAEEWFNNVHEVSSCDFIIELEQEVLSSSGDCIFQIDEQTANVNSIECGGLTECSLITEEDDSCSRREDYWVYSCRVELISLLLTRVVSKFDCVEDSCLLYTSPSPRDLSTSRMPSSA